MLTEECAAGEFAHPTRRGIAMVRVEHDSATTGFGFEDTGDNMRQQQSTKTLIGERQLGGGILTHLRGPQYMGPAFQQPPATDGIRTA